MWICKRCGKPVYFAERRQSIGFDWHRQCLRCEECGKVLHPGQHAEHKEKPYCSIPCYSALFGPKLFGHGSTVESHQSFGKRSGAKLLDSLDFERKVREYNDNVDKDSGSSKLELTSRFVNGRFVLEGVLRIYWGVQRSIRVKEFEDKRVIAKGRPVSVAVDDSYHSDVVLRRKVKSFDLHQPQRHSVMTFGNASSTKVWDISPPNQEQDLNRSSIWSTEAVSSHDIVQRTLLHRTLSDSNLLSRPPLQEPPIWSRSSYQTLPINFGRTKGAVIPLRLDRYEGLSDLSQETATLRFDYTSLQPEVMMANSLKDFDSDTNFEKAESKEESPVEFRKPSVPLRGLRRRHGRKFENRKAGVRRRSSFNGHWYDRETSVFTPPKDSCMSVWISSLVQTKEVLQMLLDKYKVENEPDRFAIFVVKETGERRMLTEKEYPLVLRVNLGPHENIARLYIFDKQHTSEVNHEVAQYLRFSYSECRAIMNMFYEEEEREVEYIRRKYKVMKKIISNLIREKWTP